MRANFDEIWRKASKSFKNERHFEENESSMNFRWFFEDAIVLPLAKNRANPRKVGRNFERHFADIIEFSQPVSKIASKFRRLFLKEHWKFKDCFKISKSVLTRGSWLPRYTLFSYVGAFFAWALLHVSLHSFQEALLLRKVDFYFTGKLK